MENACAIILAAGDGTRMKSRKPKVLCEVLFKPMLSWVLDSCAKAELTQLCVVVAPDADEVRAILPAHCRTAVQHQRMGTGHAVMAARAFLEQHMQDDVLLLYGDSPFVDEATIQKAHDRHKQEGNDLTVVAAQVDDPTGYGRIVYLEDGTLKAIVEHRDADEKTLAIKEINSGIYWFRCSFLLQALDRLTPNNAQGEYYITDCVKIATENGRRAGVYVAEGADTVLGANDRRGLALLSRIARDRVIDSHYQNGVDIPITDGVIIAPDVEIGADTCILPGTILKGHTRIGRGCVIGPNTTVEDCIIEDGAQLSYSVAQQSTVRAGARVGPYTRLRPGTVVGESSKVGNFVELKNAQVGARASVAHLSYLGDCTVGTAANIGCGVVTANYDGAEKHRTVIGDRAFIGCNANFIPPVQVGMDSIVAAGTTVTEDVPDGALVIGRTRQLIKPDWARVKGRYKKQ